LDRKWMILDHLLFFQKSMFLYIFLWSFDGQFVHGFWNSPTKTFNFFGNKTQEETHEEIAPVQIYDLEPKTEWYFRRESLSSNSQYSSSGEESFSDETLPCDALNSDYILSTFLQEQLSFTEEIPNLVVNKILFIINFTNMCSQLLLLKMK
jgi:hypothetical protein